MKASCAAVAEGRTASSVRSALGMCCFVRNEGVSGTLNHLKGSNVLAKAISLLLLLPIDDVLNYRREVLSRYGVAHHAEGLYHVRVRAGPVGFRGVGRGAVATAWTFKVAVMIVTMIVVLVTTVSCCSEDDREEGGDGEKGHFHLLKYFALKAEVLFVLYYV